MLRILAMAGLLATSGLGHAQVTVDSALPAYKPVSGVSGTIKSVGSDTMNNMMALWAQDFQKQYPGVQIEIEGKGSSTAPVALTEGTATFGPMSRDLKSSEIDAFAKVHGYPPVQLVTSIDMLAIYVHRDNPIKGLTLRQIDAIFSKTRKGGYPKDILTWGDLGLTGDWKDKPISLHGRNAASGTYGYLKEIALYKGDFRDSVKENGGSSALVQAVGNEKYAIGYSGIGYRTVNVRPVPIALEDGQPFVEAAPENAYNGEYPLSRGLLLTVNYKPGSKLDPLRREFIRFIFSQEGQTDVVKDGYLPVPADTAREQLRTVGIEAKF